VPKGIRLHKYDLELDKGPMRIGWEGREGLQSVILGGREYTYYPADRDRREDGTLFVSKAIDGKVRLTGVCHSCEKLFVTDEPVKPEEPILLEAGNDGWGGAMPQALRHGICTLNGRFART
jgi:hypothetical protein